VGSVPVYRRQDDEVQLSRNEETFRSVHEALADGAAVGIFPEGKSHGQPALVPLRTGAARMALGAASLIKRDFPIIPVGLTFSRKEMFRSEALALIGRPVEWRDLSERGETDESAVRELTHRIDQSLRGVTWNLEQWEDAPAIACAEAIYAAEYRLPDDGEERMGRLGALANGLRALRSVSPARSEALLASLVSFQKRAARLGVEPEDLSMTPRWGIAARWAMTRASLLLLAFPVLFAGTMIFYLPYRVVGLVASRVRTGRETRSTVKLLVGMAAFSLWIGSLAVAAWQLLGRDAGLACIALLPLLGVFTLGLADRTREEVADARGFLVRWRRKGLREMLRAERRALASELEEIRLEIVHAPSNDPAPGQSLP